MLIFANFGNEIWSRTLVPAFILSLSDLCAYQNSEPNEHLTGLLKLTFYFSQCGIFNV